MTPPKKLPLGLRSLFGQSSLPLEPDATGQLIQKVHLTQEEMDIVEEKTRLQAHTLVWYEQRAGRITSSVAHSVLHTNQDKPATSLMRSLCSDSVAGVCTSAMSWGRKHETTVKELYAKGDIPSNHTDLAVEDCGLVISPDHQAWLPHPMPSCFAAVMGLVF